MTFAGAPVQRALAMQSATVAATCGAAMLVPEIVRYPPPGHAERMQTPGAAMTCAVPVASPA